MRKIICTILLSLPFFGFSQHTFSIVAIDSITGEIGSAGATCGDSIIWPGTPGAILISDVIPGIGAIHTQSYHNTTNQLNAHNRMIAGDSPEEIIDWLVSNDVSSNPGIRQYGVIDYNGGSPRTTAYTGSGCFDYKNHILGSNYAIQGNILLGQQILDSMEARFNNTGGCLSDKLMAAMQGANVVGADTRCMTEGTSSLSAFLRVAKPTDDPSTLFIDLNIAGTAQGVEPLDELQIKYNNWKTNNNHDCSIEGVFDFNEGNTIISVYPNPTSNLIKINTLGEEVTRIELTDITGRILLNHKVLDTMEIIQFSLGELKSGDYSITPYKNNKAIYTRKITLQHK